MKKLVDKKSANIFGEIQNMIETNHIKISEEICMMTNNCVTKYNIPINVKMVKKVNCPCIGG